MVNPDSRGAASVTLDTIILDALLGIDESVFPPEQLTQVRAAAVKHALLARGLVDYVGPDTYEQVFVLRIGPLEAS